MGVFFFGMGYSSRATARVLHRLGDPNLPISGTTRSLDRTVGDADDGIRMHVFDGEVPGPTLVRISVTRPM